MRKSDFVVVIAVFVGFFAALQVDHFLHRPQQVDRGDFQLPPASVIPASYEAQAGAVDFRPAAKKVTSSVVSVDRYQRVMQWFSDDDPVTETATGSGVIVSANGYIVTNNHVVDGAVQVKVHTSDNHVYDAKVLGTDPRSDLAVLKIEATNLKPIELGDSESLEVGQWVMAVGNPLGFDDTVSVGVVSSLKRRLPVENGELLNAIQTDAAINPGNSGGALTDLNGKLVGINSAIASGTGQSVGIGFAIPVNRVREVFNDIVKLGYARYADLGLRFNRRYDGWLGDESVRDRLSQITGAANVPDSGVIVVAQDESSPAVVPGSGADKAGMREYDIVLAVNGEPVADSLSVARVLTPLKPGQSVSVKFWHKGEVRTANVVLGEGHGSEI